MSPVVRVFTDREEEPELYIPFPRPIHDARLLEERLPELQQDLSQRWLGVKVEIRYRTPKLRNPIDPSQVARLIRWPEGIVVLALGTAIAKGISSIGNQVTKIVVAWLKRLEPQKRKPKRARRRPVGRKH